MSTIQLRPIAIVDSSFFVDFANASVARVKRTQEEAYRKIEREGKVVSFAEELFLEIVDRLAVKPQILAEQEARLSSQWSQQRWLVNPFSALYTYSEYKAAIIDKKRDSDVIYFDRDDLSQELTRNELFSSAVKFLEEEGFIVVTEYKFKKDPYSRHKSLSNIFPVSAKLTEKGKQYFKSSI